MADMKKLEEAQKLREQTERAIEECRASVAAFSTVRGEVAALIAEAHRALPPSKSARQARDSKRLNPPRATGSVGAPAPDGSGALGLLPR
jgi:hypothetical protein